MDKLITNTNNSTEKLYVVKHKWLSAPNRGRYLNIHKQYGDRTISYCHERLYIQVKFTKKEIDELNLSDEWEIIEI